MTDAEISNLISFLAENPMAGVELQGTGGCRKLRIAGHGKGKSGGYRVVTFYSGEAIPVFLLTVFSKGEKSNISKAEAIGLKQVTKAIVDEYRARIAEVTKKGA